MKYLILDLETENHTYHKRRASPFCPNNFIVAAGWKTGELDNELLLRADDSVCVRGCYLPTDDALEQIGDALRSVQVVVGHNIKFDILWLWRFPWMQEFLQKGGLIYCTQYAQYLIKAQHEKYHMNALNDIAVEYGGTKKLDGIKDHWESGGLTSEIHEDLLMTYLCGGDGVEGDIVSTERVFLGQMKKLHESGRYAAIASRMEGLLATTMMEYNGVFIDVTEAKRRLAALKTEFAAAQEELQTFIPELPEGLNFSWGSTQMVSALTFGGAIKYRDKVQKIKNGEVQYRYKIEKEPIGVYKSGPKKGDTKYRSVKVRTEPVLVYQDRIFDFPGYTDKNDLLKGKQPKGGWEQEKIKDARGNKFFRVTDESMNILASMDVPYMKALTRYAFLNKEIGTYYVRKDSNGNLTGMLTCVEKDTHIIHHKLNHVNTITTRLSSADPNLQNLPRSTNSQVKRMFSSRFGEDGMMIEIDYSQVEIYVLAWLSGDAQLISDINSGIDLHCMRVAKKNSISYDEALYLCTDESAPDHAKWKAERTKCKIFSFQLQYGAGATTIANETGMTVQEVQELMQNEKNLYPGVDRFIHSVTQSVEKSAKPFRDPYRGYRAFRRGFWKSCTGTYYTWRSYDAPSFMRRKGITDSFSPPEIKNYPIQGTAGEVLQVAIGQLARKMFFRRDLRAFLCNTVHDCVWIDAHKDCATAIAVEATKIMQQVGDALIEIFGIEKLPIRFKVSTEIGKNMHELHKLEENV